MIPIVRVVPVVSTLTEPILRCVLLMNRRALSCSVKMIVPSIKIKRKR